MSETNTRHGNKPNNNTPKRNEKIWQANVQKRTRDMGTSLTTTHLRETSKSWKQMSANIRSKKNLRSKGSRPRSRRCCCRWHGCLRGRGAYSYFWRSCGRPGTRRLVRQNEPADSALLNWRSISLLSDRSDNERSAHDGLDRVDWAWFWFWIVSGTVRNRTASRRYGSVDVHLVRDVDRLESRDRTRDIWAVDLVRATADGGDDYFDFSNELRTGRIRRADRPNGSFVGVSLRDSGGRTAVRTGRICIRDSDRACLWCDDYGRLSFWNPICRIGRIRREPGRARVAVCVGRGCVAFWNDNHKCCI